MTSQHPGWGVVPTHTLQSQALMFRHLSNCVSLNFRPDVFVLAKVQVQCVTALDPCGEVVNSGHEEHLNFQRVRERDGKKPWDNFSTNSLIQLLIQLRLENSANGICHEPTFLEFLRTLKVPITIKCFELKKFGQESQMRKWGLHKYWVVQLSLG